MSKYRRNYLSGGIYFFTVNLRDRKSSLLIDHFSCLQNSINRVKRVAPFAINAWVVLPDHIHTIWTLPENDSDYSGRWRTIKTLFCKQLGRPGEFNARVWQPRFWEHTISSESDLYNHINYVHINPVKHGYVSNVVDWPCSSFHHYLEKGVYAESWGEDLCIPETLVFGE